VGELQGLGAVIDEVDAVGAQLLAVSPDPAERSQ
jgi:hypothetical protein